MMDELILNKNGTPVLAQSAAQRLAALEREMKKLKEESDTLKSAVLAAMETAGVLKLETPEVAVTYVAPTYRETLETAALKKEMPDVYEAYIKAQPVKASLRVKAK